VIIDHTTGVGQVTVAFSGRVSGTAPITSYDVEALDQTTNSSRWVPGVSSPVTLNGLINGDTWAIYVYANNIVGRSPPSSPVVVIPGAQPRFVSGPAANGIVGQPYTSGFAVTGVPVPTVSQVGSGQIPPGLTLDSHGNLTGTPTTAGRYHFAAKAVNPLGEDGLGLTMTIAYDVIAKIAGCSTRGNEAWGCALEVKLGQPLAVDTVFSVDIGGGGFTNPTRRDRPEVITFEGCQVAPIASPYYPGNGGYNRYDVNISSGGCTAGAVVFLEEAVTAAAGATITQPVPGLGASTATFVLP